MANSERVKSVADALESAIKNVEYILTWEEAAKVASAASDATSPSRYGW